MGLSNVQTIAAAPGWVAVCGKERGDTEPHYVYPLVGWALETIKADWATKGEQRVFGLVYLGESDGVVAADAHPTFIHYRYDGTDTGLPK